MLLVALDFTLTLNLLPASHTITTTTCLTPHPHTTPRSYQGFTCLLQLSTRTHDWVVDTLALRGQLGPALGPLLADPAVEKVLHGADNDVLWLQVRMCLGLCEGRGVGVESTAMIQSALIEHGATPRPDMYTAAVMLLASPPTLLSMC